MTGASSIDDGAELERLVVADLRRGGRFYSVGVDTGAFPDDTVVPLTRRIGALHGRRPSTSR